MVKEVKLRKNRHAPYRKETRVDEKPHKQNIANKSNSEEREPLSYTASCIERTR
jgi:hypothetical protein